jgi:hypothetical protein
MPDWNNSIDVEPPLPPPVEEAKPDLLLSHYPPIFADEPPARHFREHPVSADFLQGYKDGRVGTEPPVPFTESYAQGYQFGVTVARAVTDSTGVPLFG